MIFEKGTYVFLPDDDQCWVPAKVSSSFQQGSPGAVVLVDGERPVRISAKHSAKVQPMDEQSLQRWDDMVLLKQLDNASLLHNIRLRYAKDQIYTNIGTILISVNPYKMIPDLYSPDMQDRFINCGGNVKDMQPHIFGVAEDSYHQMMAYDTDQSCIITGESGAGKTEATKLYLQYIAERSRRNRRARESGGADGQQAVAKKEFDVPLREQILGANPLMEAFGNAKTVRNDNSSRFGKLIDVHFMKSMGAVAGGCVTNYLLEKSRVVTHLEGERSYHIFYQICAAANESDPSLKSKLKLLDADQFYYLNQSKKPSTIINGVDDAHEWESTVASMKLLNMDENHIEQVYRIIAGILHLGNITFEAISSSNDFAKVSNKESLEITAELFGVPASELERGLLTRDISNKTEKVTKKHDVREAKDSRDALAKHTYSRLFNFLTKCINDALSSRLDEARSSDIRTISVLDIFGFESFGVNSFEQLCINYCNEKLQGFFNNHIFKLEQEEYRREEIDVSQIGFSDNQGVIDTIDHRSDGIFAICDDEVNLLRGTDDGFLAKVHQKAKTMANRAKAQRKQSSTAANGGKTEEGRKKSFVRRRTNSFHQSVMGALGKSTDKNFDAKVFLKEPNVKETRKNVGARTAFIVVHFAGEVMYNVEGFLEKNRDILRTDLLQVIGNSDQDLVRDLFEGQEEAMQSGRGKKAYRKTLGRKFQEQLDALMFRLNATEPHFVRTIKPNSKKKSGIFEAPLVLDQLRYAGLLEVCRIRQMGYPVRKTHEEFFRLYCCIHPEAKDLDDLLRLLAADNLLQGTEWQKGKTKVFMRAAQFDILSKAREKALWEVVVMLQRQIRRFNARNKYIRTKTAFEDLERGIASRDKNLLETAIPFAASLPNAGRHQGLLERARRTLDEIKQEEKHLSLLEDAVSSRDVQTLPSLIKTAEKMGLGNKEIVEKARSLVKEHEERQEAMTVLQSAINSKHIPELKEAISNAEAHGLAGTTEFQTASSLLFRLEEVKKYVDKLDDAIARKDLKEMDNLIQALVDIGEANHPSVLKAQRITKKIIKESEERKAAIEALEKDLREAIDSQDLEALNNLRVRIAELGHSGPLVDEAMAMRSFLEEKEDLLQRIVVEQGILLTTSRSLDGITRDDMIPLEEAIEAAQNHGIEQVKEPRLREGIQFLKRMEQQLIVQEQLVDALDEDTFSALLKALLAAQSLAMETQNARLVAEQVRELERIKNNLNRIDQRRLREKRMSLLRYASPKEMEEVEKERMRKMDSEEYREILEEAETKSYYRMGNYYKLRDPDDWAESAPRSERAALAETMLLSSKNPIPKSLLELDEDQNVIAVRCNRAVLQYCGDIASTGRPGLFQFIIVNGLADQFVADEIYVQLVKHLTANISANSEDKAWLLMCGCSKYFPPSELLAPYLLSFLIEHRTKTGLTGNYARFLLAQLGASIQMGPSEKFKPHVDELSHYSQRPPVLMTVNVVDGSTVTVPCSPNVRMTLVSKLAKQAAGIVDAVNHPSWSIFLKDNSQPKSNDALRKRLERFYRFYNPSKIPHLEVYVQHWQDKEEELFRQLVDQYGEEPAFHVAEIKRDPEPGSSRGLLLPVTVAKAAGKLLRVQNAPVRGPSPKTQWPLPSWVFVGDVFARLATQRREPSFVLKRRFLPIKGKPDVLHYQQCKYDVELSGTLVITSDHDVAELAAIAMVVQHGDLDLEDEEQLIKLGLAKHIPRAWLDEKPIDAWARQIATSVDLGSDGDSALRGRYVEICKRAPAYGLSLYSATRADSGRAYVIGVDSEAIHVLSLSLDSIVRSFPIRSIKKFGASSGTFFMKISKSKLKKDGQNLGRRVSRRFGGAKPKLKQETTGMAGGQFDFLKRKDGLDIVLNTLQAWECYDIVFSATQMLKEKEKK